MAAVAPANDSRNQQFRSTAETLGAPGAFNLRQPPRKFDINGNRPDEILARLSGNFRLSDSTIQGDNSDVEERAQEKQDRAVAEFGQAMDEAFDGPGEKSWFDSAYDRVADAASGVWNGVTKAWDSVGDKFTSLWENAKKSVTGAANYAGDKITGAVDAVSTTATNAWNTTTNFVSGSYAKTKNWLFGSSKPETAANTNTPVAAPAIAAPVPEAIPLVGSETNIEMKSAKSIAAQFNHATTAPEADNSNDLKVAPTPAPRMDFVAAPAA